MAEPDSLIRQAVRGLRILGPNLVLQAALYPFRKAYHRARLDEQGKPTPLSQRFDRFKAALRETGRPAPPAIDEFTFPGALLEHRAEGQIVYLTCERGAYQITVLAGDLLRVRYRPDGEFAPPVSYAVCRPDDEWPSAPFSVVETDAGLEIRTETLICRIERDSSRLAFLDLDGTPISEDRSGAGYCDDWAGCWRHLDADEHIYGLGEKAAGLDHRGQRYEMWNTDPQTYSPGDDPLYMSFPVYLGLRGGSAYGIFFDNAYRSIFDIGQTDPSTLHFVAAGGEMRYYFFYGPAMGAILARYTELTGRMYLPPLWSLGYHQNRWSYYPESRVRNLAAEFRRQRIPCDAIHLDIHYMDGYRNFTWDWCRFPNLPDMVADLAGDGFKTVAMIDAGFKADRQNSVCADGLRRDVFIKHPDGRRFRGPVWPGNCYFPDYTDPKVREWFGQQYAVLLDLGIAGIWNDMNEPTIISTQGEFPPDHVRHDLDGQGGDHRAAHNVYGMQMARATCEGLRRLRPDQRPFIITRSAFSGTQRYSLGWTADNESTWESLAITIPMLLNLSLSGLAFVGPDTGGFEGDCTGELLTRWNQLSLFTPLFRNHSALGTRDQEPWAFGEPYTTINRQFIEWRYRFLPAIYTAFWQCSRDGTPMMRPLCMGWQDDPRCATIEDQFQFGDHLLVAPVLHEGQTTRSVYLPAGEWCEWWSDERIAGPAEIMADAPLDRMPLYVRAGAVLPMGEAMQYVGETPVEKLTLHLYAGTGTSHLYEDAGDGWDHLEGDRRHTTFDVEWNDSELTLTRCVEGSYTDACHRFDLVVHGLSQAPASATADDEPLEWRQDMNHTLTIRNLTEFDRLTIHL